MLLFIESGKSLWLMAILAGIGMLAKLLTDFRYKKLVRQSENMGATKDTYLRQWKSRFENTFRMNHGINNMQIYVEKNLQQCKLLGIRISRWDRLNRLAAGFCLLCGMGFALTTYYLSADKLLSAKQIVSAGFLAGIMMFWEMFCATGKKRRRLKLNVQDYLENTLVNRLKFGIEMSGMENEAGEKTKPELSESGKKDIRYLRESLDKIAAGKEPGYQEGQAENSRDEEELIEEIIREYLF